MTTLLERVKAWVSNNKQVAVAATAIALMFVTAIWITGHQGEKHMRHISDLVHKYDSASCERLIQEKTLTQTEALQEKQDEINTLTAKSVHLEQVQKGMTNQQVEMTKQLTAAQNAAKAHKQEASRLATQLHAALQLQNELMERMKSNEEAYDQAKRLEEMFKTVKSEFESTSKIVEDFQKSTQEGEE
mmetsp:Transcript_2502/g.7158  ORF Transcript_2502/g.7158 Transcript_2502/m.7158 type:complete len:188 (-) Transcript_2502:136-699(-)|eukprot:CAMPEP_0117648234 /NCGR_PEP_ID=MMETSP0804-20121206/283_1 /TAXON_ID=1074897 /ORGANISM="Tetraselmis astigmatica, Strain CCMP880" /LENGTH=187 /DNA_ID=CAMNT_0005453797 /DNA_START=176 /DNA_END=739 /DNA_ORIENTATION=-